ncbi:MAG: ABC transporter ATP-binding protein [Clostridiales bacterium]|nr:ABC transporter ATP-binding protein [Clostridiales bacterium]
MMDREPLLQIKGLSVRLRSDDETQPMVRGVDLLVKRGGCTGIIGESGCGKSTLCNAIMGLLPAGQWLVEGEMLLGNEQVPIENDRRMDAYRGSRMSMIVQNPLAAFDPRMTIRAHFLEGCPWRERAKMTQQAMEQLDAMMIRDPETVMKSYPFQLSGGMLQRVMIAISLLSSPELLIADEPTTALDSTVQAEILSLLRKLQRERGISMLLVSHDLDVVSRMADTLYVMRAGKFVEWGMAEDVCNNPGHPYTKSLFQLRSAFSSDTKVHRIR